MAYTDAASIGELITVDSGDDLTPFIAAANALVEKWVVTEGGITDATLLAIVETWLGAHFYSVYKPRRSSEKADVVGAAYQYKVGFNLATSMYGQQAMVLDPSGQLASLNVRVQKGGRRAVSITHLGTTVEDPWA